MSRFTKSVLGGLLFAFYLMCFVFPIMLVMSWSDNTPIDAFLGQMLVDFFFLWAICATIANAISGLLEEANKPRPRDPSDNSRDNNGSDSLPHRNDQPSDKDQNGDHNVDGSPKK